MNGEALIGDVGGTHTRLAIAAGGRYRSTRRFLNAAAGGIAEVIEMYLSEAGAARLEAAWLAVAAPVHEGRAELTNLGWEASASELRAAFGFDAVHILNDFEALAHALPALTPGDGIPIGTGAPVPGAPAVVLGPGTGLGAAIRIPVTPSGHVVATEAGHATLAASTDEEARVLAALRKRHEHVSAERVLSGPGLVTLHETLAQAEPGAGPGDPREVVRRARAGEDRVARAALEHFFAFLGGFAGNLALSVGARGGIFLAGGILPQLREELRASRFREAFEAKGRFRAYLASIPTRLITREDPALLGLAALAARGR